MAKVNAKHKDTAFALYFSDKERLIEHQSTLNENMPLRILVYIGRLYEKVMQLQKIYGSRLVKIPTPKFVVLYHGEDKCPNHRVMKLSDAFITEETDPALELKVDLYNINYGESDLLEKSSSLKEYSTFIHYIRVMSHRSWRQRKREVKSEEASIKYFSWSMPITPASPEQRKNCRNGHEWSGCAGYRASIGYFSRYSDSSLKKRENLQNQSTRSISRSWKPNRRQI